MANGPSAKANGSNSIAKAPNAFNPNAYRLNNRRFANAFQIKVWGRSCM